MIGRAADAADGAGPLWGQPRSTAAGLGGELACLGSRNGSIIEVDEDSRRRFVTTDTGSSGYWLAARLQAALMLGRAPEVARALTAMVPGGGQWMIRRAQSVQVSSSRA